MATIHLPGIGGSGPEHWQTLWEAADASIARFAPESWDAPDLGDWTRAMARAVAAATEPPLLVAHSLACLLVAQAAARGVAGVGGAVLVSVPDAAGPAFPREAAGFGPVPTAPLPFPALVIASTNDPFGTLDHMQRCAQAWGAGLVVAGPLGHINAASGLGDWPQGAALVAAFRAGARV